jgi:uncharacterized protein
MLDLLDWRRRVIDMYQTVRDTEGDRETWAWFRNQRDWLFQMHEQSPLDNTQRRMFRGLDYYDYDSNYRVVAEVDLRVEAQRFEFDLGEDGRFSMRRFAKVRFQLPTGRDELNVYWIEGYGGGIFLPFGDATNNSSTYGGGRYLYDTIKGADLGTTESTMVLDFNYAYNPSCAYNPRWVCPLPPQENRLWLAISAGERMFKE